VCIAVQRAGRTLGEGRVTVPGDRSGRSELHPVLSRMGMMIASVPIRSFRDSQVPVITHPLNYRHILSGNEGLDTLNREYLAKFTVSDIVLEGSIRRSDSLLPACQSIDFICRSDLVISEGESPLPVRDARNCTILPGLQWLRRWAKRVTNCLMKAGAIILQLPRCLSGSEQESSQLNLSLPARYALHGLR
jgi:hypothetical protein